MKSLNRVFLLGHVGHAPELKQSKEGQAYTRLSVATHRHWKGENDQFQEATDWHSVMVWGTLARICSQGLQKGHLVFVEAELAPYTHTKEDGSTESRLSLRARQVSFFNGQTIERKAVA